MKLWLLSSVWMTPLLWAAPSTPALTCERDRYYEGEMVICTAEGIHASKASWSVLGKALYCQPLQAQPTMKQKAPGNLRAVTPLQLKVGSYVTRVSVFPRDSKYWVGEKEFEGKRIGVPKTLDWILPELHVLGIPYALESTSDLQKLRRADVSLSEVDFEGIDRGDPWLRWELVQRIRKALASKK